MGYYTEPPQPKYWDCGCCGGTFSTARNYEWYECEHPECQAKEADICAECSEYCKNCDKRICWNHMDADNEYCVTCRAKYPKTQQTEEAA